MEFMTSWHREGFEEGISQGFSQGISQGFSQGISQGISQGKETLVLRLLHRQLGAVSPETTAQIAKLSPDRLDDLGEALLDFSSITELEKWLAQ